MTTQEPTQAGSDSRPLLFIGAGILALVIVSVAVVLIVGRSATTQYPADSPEGAFQRYLTAFHDSDYEAAYAYFSDRVKDQMSEDDFRQNAQMYGGGFGPYGPSQRVLFQDSSGEGDHVRLDLVVEYVYGQGLGSGSDRQPRQVNMVREDGEWRIDDPLIGIDPGPIGPPF